MNGGRVVWPASVKAHAPVRADGEGEVILSDGIHLGFHGAPRIGSGEILLQARDKEAKILIGAGTATSNNVSMIAMESIRLGKDCRIGDMTMILDCDFHEVDPVTRNEGPGTTAPVALGDNVWIGSRVIILKGVTIGDNSVIAAGSVVTKSIPANTVAAGIPAKVIRELDPGK